MSLSEAQAKLIIVEGMWGSGKSTTAKLIRDHSAESGIETRLFLEGDLDQRVQTR
jgi:thymidylate kinase